MAIKTLEEKFVHGLGDIYDAEHRFFGSTTEDAAECNFFDRADDA